MATNLAVFTTELGASFIDRHVHDLRPGATVVVARWDRHPFGAGRKYSLPVFRIDQWSLGLTVRIAQRLGASYIRLRDEAIARFLKRQNVGIVLGEYLDNFVDFVPLMDRLGMPYVVQSHGMDASKELRRPAMAQRYQAFTSARAVLTRCELHRRRLIDLGLSPEKVHLNPGGVDVPEVPTKRSPAAAKRLLAVGSMVPKKGPIFLLDSFRRAAERDPGLTLDYVGGGPLFPAAQQFVQAFGLERRVRLHGYASDEIKRRLLLECGVFVQHSVTSADGDEEGLPAAIQEAMAHGLAVVSTRHAGIPEAVAEGVTGLLIDECDVHGMAEALFQVPVAAVEMGAAGHRRAAANYDWAHEKARLLRWLFAY